MWSGFSDLLTKATESLVTIGDDVGKNLEGISSGLPKFDLPTFEAPSFGVPMLDDVKNEFTSFSTPLDELKVDLPALAPLPELSMPTLEQIKKTTEEARKAFNTDLSEEWNSVVPSFEEIKKEAVGLSSDIGLAMELNLKDILEAKGEKHLGQSIGIASSLEEPWYRQNYAAGIEITNKCDDEIKKVVLLSYNQQHQWRLFKEKMEIVPLLMGDMDDLRGKLAHITKKLTEVEELLNTESELQHEVFLQREKADKLRELAQKEADANATVEALREDFEREKRKDEEVRRSKELEEQKRRDAEQREKQILRSKKLEADFGRQMKDYEIYGMMSKTKTKTQVKLEDVVVEPTALDELDGFFDDEPGNIEANSEKTPGDDEDAPGFEYLEDEEPDFG